MNQILLGEILFVPSKSRYELEREKSWAELNPPRKGYALARQVLLERNLPHGKDALHDEVRARIISDSSWENIWGGHLRQKKALAELAEVVRPEQIVDRSKLPEELDKYALIVSLGGDNHFQYCGQVLAKEAQERCNEEKYIAGVVLDRKLSAGALLSYDKDSFLSSLDDLESGNYELEKWATLEAEVDDGKNILKPYNAVSEMLIGELDRSMTSRVGAYNSPSRENPILPEKTSGVLAAVGAGSGKGSWYSNIKSCYADKGDENNDYSFGKEEVIAKLIATEHPSKAEYIMKDGERIIIDSYNDDHGIVRPDSHKEHGVPFMMGSVAKLWVSDYKLPVISPAYDLYGDDL